MCFTGVRLSPVGGSTCTSTDTASRAAGSLSPPLPSSSSMNASADDDEEEDEEPEAAKLCQNTTKNANNGMWTQETQEFPSHCE